MDAPKSGDHIFSINQANRSCEITTEAVADLPDVMKCEGLVQFLKCGMELEPEGEGCCEALASCEECWALGGAMRIAACW